MASASSSPTRMQRRDSSERSFCSRRPRLLRATATEPSITTSNASPNALATPPGRRASELLSRVAFVSGSPPDSVLRSASMLSTRSSMYDSVDRHSELSSSPVSQPELFDDMNTHSCSGRYFSFPSFDLYEENHQDEKGCQMKSP
ncbi:hypothetical protein N658DRAFT_196944 [Parathielavia hyrcaniae]|uniref:Uncharacterized protein n=1 Tax=Parathielavia hyrcaniae TaxID=113614 RepID=A0AAN6Q7C9_9PEZI|nr:hypothetical protein N658DRAFT_196944 [Parathielavia hyrcaniae]